MSIIVEFQCFNSKYSSSSFANTNKWAGDIRYILDTTPYCKCVWRTVFDLHQSLTDFTWLIYLQRIKALTGKSLRQSICNKNRFSDWQLRCKTLNINQKYYSLHKHITLIHLYTGALITSEILICCVKLKALVLWLFLVSMSQYEELRL